MKLRLLISLILAGACLFGQTVDSSPRTPAVFTVSTLPAAASWTNQTALVTDGSAAGDCTTGSGSTRVLCVSNGSAWAAVAGSGGGGGGTMFTTTGTGSYWPWGGPISLTNQTNHGANKMVYFEFVVPASINVTYIGSFGGTLDSGKHYTFCLYDSSSNLISNGNGGTLTDGGTNAFRVTLPAQITLAAGTYFLGWTTDSTVYTLEGNGDGNSGGGTLAASIMNTDTTKRIFTGANNSTGTTTLTCPSSIGARTSISDVLPPAVLMP